MRVFHLLGIGLVAGHVALAASPSITSIPKTDRPLVIDGVLDEPCWKHATPIRADYVNSKLGVLSGEPRMAARYCWDEHYLYIGYETFDRNLLALGSGQKEGPPDNQREGCEIWHPQQKLDVVEFFISFGDERFFWELHHNAANQFNDVWCTVPDPSWPVSQSSMATWGIIFGFGMVVQDDGAYRLAKAVHLKPKADGKPSSLNDPSDTDTGYTAELRLPWLGIGAPARCRTWLEREPAQPGGQKVREPGPWKLEGQEILILAVVQDGDLTERYHHSSPTRKGDWFHKSAGDWPRCRLGAARAPAR